VLLSVFVHSPLSGEFDDVSGKDFVLVGAEIAVIKQVESFSSVNDVFHAQNLLALHAGPANFSGGAGFTGRP
jgi:hypothetical protein